MDENIMNIEDKKSNSNIEDKKDNNKITKNDDYVQNLPEWDLVPPFTMLKRVIRK